jgi:hypothetical protein
MPPTVAIIERHQILATSLKKVVLFAHCIPVVLSNCEELALFTDRPAVVIVRITETTPSDLPGERLRELAGDSWVIALTTTYADLLEARRLRCDVVLQPTQQEQALYETLRHVLEVRPPVSATDVGAFFLFT